MPHANVPNLPLRSVRVMVTGAGGPAAVSVMKSLGADASVSLIAADMDPWAAGLYLVPPEARTLVPAGTRPPLRRRHAGPLRRDGGGRADPHVRRGAAPAGQGQGRVPPGRDRAAARARFGARGLPGQARARRALRRAPSGAEDRAPGQGRRPRVLDLPGDDQAPERERVAGHLGRGVQRGAPAAGTLARLPGPGLPARRGVLSRRPGRRHRPRGRGRAAGPRAGRLRGLGGGPHGARRRARAAGRRRGRRHRPHVRRECAVPPGRRRAGQPCSR